MIVLVSLGQVVPLLIFNDLVTFGSGVESLRDDLFLQTSGKEMSG